MKIEFYAVVTEFDCHAIDADAATGPLLHEMYPLKTGTLEQARTRVKQLGNGYGWAKVARVTVDFDASENQPSPQVDFDAYLPK